MLGNFIADHTGALHFGLPPTAYSRAEPMSDALHCLLFNPFFVVESPES